MTALRRAAILLAAFAAGTIVFTWPLAAHLRHAYLYLSPDVHALGLADSYLTTWMTAWVQHALLTGPTALFDANILHPITGALAFSEHMIGAAIVMLPIHLVLRDPVTEHNLFLLLSFVLGGTGTALLVMDLGGSIVAGLVGGAVFAFGPPRLGYVSHVHLLATEWMPLALLCLHRVLRGGRWPWSAGFAACLLLEALTSVYHAYYFGLAVVVFLAAHALCGAPAAPGTRRRALLLGLGVALAMAPTFLPYVDLRDRFALERDPNEAVWLSAVGDLFLDALRSPMSYLRRRYLQVPGPIGLIGLGTFVLLALGVARGAAPARGGRRAAAAYLLTAVVMALVSMGPSLRLRFTLDPGWPGPYTLLAAVIPGFEGLRVPVRAAIPAFLAVAVLGGLGAETILTRARTRGRRTVAVAVLAAVTLLECWRAPLHAVPIRWSGQPLPIHRWLATQPASVPIVELPLGAPELDAVYEMLSTSHWHRLVNGYTGFSPAGTYLRTTLAGFPDAESLRLLAALRVRYAILHDALLARPLCGELAGGSSPFLAVRWSDTDSCALEILGAPAGAPVPADRPVPLAGARLVDPAGGSVALAVDGDRGTHWIQPVRPDTTGWLEVDLPVPHPLTRVVLRLGRHFGDYPRQLRVETSTDGETWTAVLPDTIVAAPLPDLLRDRDDLAVELRLPPTATARLRLVRPASGVGTPWDLFASWRRWGIHELELYEATGG